MEKRRTLIRCTAAAVLLTSLILNAVLLCRSGFTEKKEEVKETPLAVPVPEQAVSVPADGDNAPLVIRSTHFNSYDPSFMIYFNRKIDFARAKEFLAVTPDLPFHIGGGNNTLTVSGSFKAGVYYQLVLKKGFPLADGEKLKEELKTGFIVPDRYPELRFASNGRFYPVDAAAWELPVRLVNVEDFEAELSTVYPNRLADFLSDPGRSYTRPLKTLKLKGSELRNENDYVALPFDQLGIPRVPGVYHLRINHSGRWENDSRVVLVTDLALQAIAGDNEVAFAVRSIRGNQAVPGAVVELLSRKFQPLGKGETDAEGFGKINYAPSGDRTDYPAMLLVRKGEDVTYLVLDEMENSPERRERPEPAALSAAYNAFLSPERGICRPGEKIGVFGFLREAETLHAATGVPLEFTVIAPTGGRFSTATLTGDRFGYYHQQLELPPDAATGSYRVTLSAPGENGRVLGRTSFLVAEYVSDQLKMSVTPEMAPLAKATEEPAQTAEAGVTAVASGDILRLTGSVNYYFGAPLTDAPVTIRVNATPGRFAPRGWERFTFGCDDFSFPETIRATGKTDAQGRFAQEITFPAPAVPPALPQLLCADVSVQPPGGGRMVAAQVEVPRHFRRFYTGLQMQENGEFTLAAVTPGGEPADPDTEAFSYKLTRQRWNYILKEESGQLRYEWQEISVPVSEGKLDLLLTAAPGIRTFRLALPQAGYYTLTVQDKAECPVARLSFWHSAGESGERTRNPALLVFDLDREKARPGETVKASFDSPFAGEAVMTTGDNRVRSMRSFPVKAGLNSFEVSIPAGVPQGSFFAGITVATAPAENSKAPQRLFGLVRIAVDRPERKLDVRLSAPGVCRPGEAVKIRAEIRGDQGQALPAGLHIWAVDAGILALTDWNTPDPFAFFFGEVNSLFRFGDTYSNLYPQIRVDSLKTGGGDGAKRGMGAYHSPQFTTVKAPAVIAMRSIEVPADGNAEFELQLPRHTGALRLMAIAADGLRTGSAERELQLRDPVSVQLAAPRAVAPGDEFELRLTVFNHELEETEFAWSLQVGDTLVLPGERSGSFRLKKGESKSVPVSVRAGIRPGEAAIEAELRAGKEISREKLTFAVRPAFPAVDRVSVHSVEPGRTAEFSAAAGSALPVGNSTVEIGTPLLTVAGALDWLNNYPYGCLEQTVAGAFPFLAVGPLVKAGLLPEGADADADRKIRSALSRIDGMRKSGIYFTMWPGERNAWNEGSLFACHFLLEAAQAGYPLKDGERKALAAGFRQFLNNGSNPADDRAYALYLLSMADSSAVKSYADGLLADNPGSFGRFLTGSALIRGKYASEGAKVLTPLLETRFWSRPQGKRAALDSEVRRLGLSLWILGEVMPGSGAESRLGFELSRQLRPQGHWGSTQDNAWAVLGLSRGAAKYKGGFRGTFRVEGGEELPLSGKAFRTELVAESKFRVANTGPSPFSVFLRTRGIPEKPQPCADGFSIRREYLDESGKAVTRCKTGELLKVRITLAADAAVDNIVISDLLPGGLEIEDGRLATRSMVFREQTTRGLMPRMIERLDDRFLLFGNVYSVSVPVETTYQVRAVTRGRFAIPAIQVESMYNPEMKAVAVSHESFVVE